MPNTESEKYHVVIDAGNDMTEVIVVNSWFERLAKELRRVELDLAPGLYQVKMRLGESTTERFISVPEQTSLIDAPEDVAAAPEGALLDLTTWDPQERMCEEMIRSGATPPPPGTGIVTIFVREAGFDPLEGLVKRSEPRRTDPNRAAQPDQISLRDLNGVRLLSLDSTQAKRPAGFSQLLYSRVWPHGAVAGFCAVLPTGGYILQSRARNINTVGMSVWVAKGFDTRVYLERRMVSSVDTQGRPDRRRIADLSRASVVMVKPGTDIAQGDAAECLRVTEMARTTLATERPIFPREVLQAHMIRKFEYPMLGVLGAHLLALQPEPDTALLTEVAYNLEHLVLPRNPDVAALHRLVGEGCPPVTCPPMLRTSWDILAARSSSDPGVIAPSGVVAWVGSNLSASRPWLIWNGSAKHAMEFDESRDRDQVHATIEALKRRATDPISAARVASQAKMNTGLAASLVEAVRKIDPVDTDPLAELSERLKLPRATVGNALLGMELEE